LKTEYCILIHLGCTFSCASSSCVSIADGGLEELEDEFNSGKMMYAFVRVNDPNTNLKKFIVIVWVSNKYCFPQ